MAKKKGIFITFEGGEGVGKSTQINLLVRYLKFQGHRVLLTREPGGTPLGEKLRRMHKEENLDPLTQVFVLEASRADHVRRVISPALKKGFIVVCDRFQESTVVYQGIVQGVDLKFIALVNRAATGGLQPDRVILLDGGLNRLKGRSRKDRFDQASRSFHLKVRRGFLKLAKGSRRFRVFQADQDRLTLHRQIVQDLKSLLN